MQQRATALEEAVTNHAMFSDAYGQCYDWLRSQANKLVSCNEPSADRHSVKAKLDLVNEVQTALPSGEQKWKTVQELGALTLTQSSLPGQEVIRQQLAAMDDEWSRLCGDLADCQQRLEASNRLLQDHESLQESLGKWLKDKEALTRDTELRSSLPDKKQLLNKLKV